MKRIPPARRRELLLDAAFRVISQHGVQAATTRAICAEADMPLASFHYVFESQQELMRELLHRVIDGAGDAQRFPELTDDVYRNVELMLLSTFEWAVDHPGEELAYFELGHYALRTEGMKNLPRERIEHALDLIVRAMQLLDAIHEDLPPYRVDLREVAWMTLTFIEGNALMFLSSGDVEATRHAIRTYARFLVDFSRGPVIVGQS